MMQKYMFLRFILLSMATALLILTVTYLGVPIFRDHEFPVVDIFSFVWGLAPVWSVVGFLMGLCAYGTYRLSLLLPSRHSKTERPGPLRPSPAPAIITGLTTGILGAYPLGIYVTFLGLRIGVWPVVILCGITIALIFTSYIMLASRKTQKQSQNHKNNTPPATNGRVY